MIHVFCGRKSTGALELVQALGASRLRQFDGMDFWRKNKRVRLTEGDVVICWGHSLPDLDGIRVLNGEDPRNKFEQAIQLQYEGIPTIRISDHKVAGFIPRSNNHIGGNDLINPPARPDFWVEQDNFVREYRLHSFSGKSIRAGQKVPREGYTEAKDVAEYEALRARGALIAHPWIRAYDTGWRVVYNGFKSSMLMRKMANKAVKILGLTFGAVDIGERADGTLIVLEVNRAPGIEGGTIDSYVKAIGRWIDDSGRAEPNDPNEDGL